MDGTLIVIFLLATAIFVFYRIFVFLERLYVLRYKKTFFRNLILFPKQLSDKHYYILKHQFSFYSRLNSKEQKVFRHRVATFITTKIFVGRGGLEPTDAMKTLIASTAVMLTFGFRNYLIDLIEIIIIYPNAYYSQNNETYHKGEVNPRLKTIVFSWEDFEKGYDIDDDNLNLGIHEFGHAIHLNAYQKNDVSSLIFKARFNDLTKYLSDNKDVKEELVASKYFRAYAYTNKFEFFAVLLENFIETPTELKANFPQLYDYLRNALNFNFAKY